MEIKIKKPLQDWVLIKPRKIEEKVIGGLILPSSSNELYNTAEVLMVGDGTKDVDTSSLKVGDFVMYQNRIGAGIEIKSEEGENLLLIKFDGLFAKVD